MNYFLVTKPLYNERPCTVPFYVKSCLMVCNVATGVSRSAIWDTLPFSGNGHGGIREHSEGPSLERGGRDVVGLVVSQGLQFTTSGLRAAACRRYPG